jgi:hypothetical protein
MSRYIFRFLLLIALFLGSSVSPGSADEATTSAKQSLARQTYSLLELDPVAGFWATNHDVLINGRIFDKAGILGVGWFFDGKPSRPTILFKNEGDYDTFEAWVGFRDFSGDGKIQFEVKGDGKSLFQSDFMSARDPAVHISVPIKDYSGIALSAVCTREVRFTNSAIWGNPIFIKTSSTEPLTAQALAVSTPGAASSLSPVTALSPLEDKMTVMRTADGTYAISINERPINFGYVKPQMQSGRLLVPMRKIFEALGASVRFDRSTGVILASRNQREVQMTVGSTSATVNGQLATLDVPVNSSFGTTLVPLRFVLNAFEVKVEYR